MTGERRKPDLPWDLHDLPVLVWLRQDLRLTDNPALIAAAAQGRPIVPVCIRDEASAGDWAPGGASRWWLHHSLVACVPRCCAGVSL